MITKRTQTDLGIAYDGITAAAAPASRKCQGSVGVYHAKSKREKERGESPS